MLDLTPSRKDLDPIEVASRDEIAALQMERLERTLRRVYDTVPHYRKALTPPACTPIRCARSPTSHDSCPGSTPYWQ